MASTVYLTRIADWKDPHATARRLKGLLDESALLADVAEKDLAAVKLTFGEAGNRGHAHPALVREIVTALRRRGARPFLTETNTLYPGRRKDSVEHLQVAREHGFTHETMDAPIILADGLLGRDALAVPLADSEVGIAHLAPLLRDTDFLVGVAHLTGHLLTGFGGAIKNIGMGLANRAGKLAMHSVVHPTVSAEKCTLCLTCVEACAYGAITPGERAVAISGALCTGCAECLAVCPSGAIGIDWSGDSSRVQRRLAEYALAVRRCVDGRVAFVTLINHVSRHCDCMGHTPDRIAPDVGIVASTDPVALDQASVDLVIRAAEGDPFRRVWPEVDWAVQLEHAARIGLGARSYDLVELSGDGG
jgi:uncharacterized protein